MAAAVAIAWFLCWMFCTALVHAERHQQAWPRRRLRWVRMSFRGVVTYFKFTEGMMDIGKTFASDSDKETKGVWHELDQGGRLLVARMNNSNYNRVLRAKLAPFKQAIRTETLSEGTATKCHIEAMAETILLNWEGLTDSGAELPYTRENAIKLLSAPHLKDFRTMVERLAEDATFYRSVQIEEGAENLKPGSGGTSDMEHSSSGS